MRRLVLASFFISACFDLGASPPVCGDNTLDPGEACDDGNTLPGDGCDAACQIEEPPPKGANCDESVMTANALAFCNEVLLTEFDPSDCQDSPGETPEDLCDVSLRTHVMPIITNPTTCGNTLSCHGATNAPEGFRVDSKDPSFTLQSLLAEARQLEDAPTPLPRIEPGDPEQSYLIHKLLGTHLDVGGSGLQMPFLQDPLCNDDIATICFWVAAGAQDN